MLKREIVGYSKEHSQQAASSRPHKNTVYYLALYRPPPRPGHRGGLAEQEPDFCEEESLHPKNSPPSAAASSGGPQPQKSVTLK